jgi:hypothetical protein
MNRNQGTTIGALVLAGFFSTRSALPLLSSLNHSAAERICWIALATWKSKAKVHG